MADSKLDSLLKQASKELKNTFLEKACRDIDYATYTSGNGKILYGFITKIMNKTNNTKPWINRNITNFAYKQFYKRKKTMKVPTPLIQPDDSLITMLSKCKSERPKGTTI